MARSRILEHPEVIKSIEEQIRRQFAGYGDSVGEPRSDWGRPGLGRADQRWPNCPTCSFDNSDDSNFCRRCGSRLITVDPNETTITYSAADREDSGLDGVEHGRRAGTVLLIRSGGGREGETIALDADVLTIGRSPHSDLFLDDVTVSRHHARVLRDEGGFWVEDLNSLNGTYVNRKRIEQHRLFDGDELQIGKFKLAFVERIGRRVRRRYESKTAPCSTIGQVVDQLKPDFPDLSITKVRYLEDRGLLAPSRTPGRYRKYSAADVRRLRTILTLQRDEYLPLEVIRERVEAPSSAAPGPAACRVGAPGGEPEPQA